MTDRIPCPTCGSVEWCMLWTGDTPTCGACDVCNPDAFDVRNGNVFNTRAVTIDAERLARAMDDAIASINAMADDDGPGFKWMGDITLDIADDSPSAVDEAAAIVAARWADDA